jgi:tetratricopeptide (TPR) repeat protein
MAGQDGFELWVPGSGGEPVDLNNQANLNEAILEAARTSDAEVTRLVSHLASIGHYYQAARCLEIVAQHKLGLEFTGEELLSYQFPGFGAFHHVIYDLLRAGALYHQARRIRTAEAAFRRALLFVEEALRNINGLERVDNGEMACLGLAFELAGHCCVALDDSEGLEYYRAAQKYWGQAARMRPEAMFKWSHHPVTQTVIRCLGPAVETRSVRRVSRDDLFASDYMTRIGTASSLLA